MSGRNEINGEEFPLIFPDSFFSTAKEYWSDRKTVSVYFNGFMPKVGERPRLLQPFVELEGSRVIDSSWGRRKSNKSRMDKKYMQALARARFGACPNQVDWPGPPTTRWTYRFIECCMAGTIPIEFEETKSGANFLAGFDFEIFNGDLIPGFSLKDYRNRVNHNFALALERHSLPRRFKA